MASRSSRSPTSSPTASGASAWSSRPRSSTSRRRSARPGAISFVTPFDQVEQLALVFGDISAGKAVPVRLHRENVLEDVFGTRTTLNKVFEVFKREGCGILVYLQEGAAGVPAGQLGAEKIRQCRPAPADLARRGPGRADPARSQCQFDPARSPPPTGTMSACRASASRSRRRSSSTRKPGSAPSLSLDCSCSTARPKQPQDDQPILIGWREKVSLPAARRRHLLRQDRHRRALGGTPCHQHRDGRPPRDLRAAARSGGTTIAGCRSRACAR